MPYERNRVKGRIRGRCYEPVIIKCEGSVSEELGERIKELDYNTPLMISAQTGSGKNYAIIHVAIPYLRSRGLRGLIVASRTAITTQFKKELVKETGQESLLEELTEQGWEKHAEFDGVTVITYQALYLMMKYHPEKLGLYDLIVFDEIHALLEDASFVSCTGYILKNIQEVFGTRMRIYLTATPEEILPELVRAEEGWPLTVLVFRRDYSYVRLHFFHDMGEITSRINRDKSNNKWLWYVPSIRQGEEVSSRLNCPVKMLNSVMRGLDPDEWARTLNEQRFDEKVAIATSVIDAGVNLWDNQLKNIVYCGSSLISLRQFLGRKRYSGEGTVNLYVWCPSKEDAQRASHEAEALHNALEEMDSNYQGFIEHHVLSPREHRDDMRRFVFVDTTGKLRVNPLAKVKLKNEREFFANLLERVKKNQGNCGYDRMVASCLGIRGLDYEKCWLDVRYNGKAKAELEKLVLDAVGGLMDEEGFMAFADRFRNLCVLAYGKGEGGKDRIDRTWGVTKINNKLEELGFDCHVQVNKDDKLYSVVTTENGFEEEDNYE